MLKDSSKHFKPGPFPGEDSVSQRHTKCKKLLEALGKIRALLEILRG